MSSHKPSEYIIQFVGLKVGKHEFVFLLDDNFFNEATNFDLRECKIEAKVALVKEETYMEWQFETSGSAICDCDRCGDEMKIHLEGQQKLIVKYGEEEMELDEELVQIPYEAYHFNIKNYLAECVLLNMPMRRVHSSKKECNQEALENLEKLRYKEKNDSDPRWDALNELNN